MLRPPEPDQPPGAPRYLAFGTTCWSLVLAAAGQATPGADEALASLCASYWYPLYAFIRRRGQDPDQAADLTQGFFTRLLEKEFLRSVDPSKGRFRTIEHDRETALKRGGGVGAVSIDLRDAEGRYLAEPSRLLTPERIFERRRALTVLSQSLDQLGQEFARQAKPRYMSGSIPSSREPKGAYPIAEVGATLGMTEAAVKKAAQRLRHRYRESLREWIAETLADSSQVEDEIRTPFVVLSS